MALSDPFQIRDARSEEAAGIARVHVDAWRDAYAALLPSQHLTGLDRKAQLVQDAGVVAIGKDHVT